MNKNLKNHDLELYKILENEYYRQKNGLEFNNQEYDKFCSTFPYIETDDQLNSINEDCNNIDGTFYCGDSSINPGKTIIPLNSKTLNSSDHSFFVVLLISVILLSIINTSHTLWIFFKGSQTNPPFKTNFFIIYL